MKRIIPLLGGLCLTLASLPAHAASGRADYDLDGDGLIEINDLADLDEIRNNLSGTALYGSNAGCPVAGCTGFELAANLDFDTSHDGVMNASDAYWNSGAGWLPIGTEANPFAANFVGNDHSIRNLYIDRSGTDNVGLFGFARFLGGGPKSITALTLSGPLMHIQGYDHVGSLAGEITNMTVSYTHADGQVSGNDRVGGLVGFANNSGDIRFSDAGGTVSGASSVGGLVGYASFADVQDSHADGNVSGTSDIGGLIGHGGGAMTVSSSYATGDVNGTAYIGGLAGSFQGFGIAGTYATGAVSGSSYVGGLVGSASNVMTMPIEASFTTGPVSAIGGYVGGVVGSASTVRLAAVYATGAISGPGAGGIAGSISSSSITNSYWATDTTGQLSLYGSATSTTATNSAGVTLSELKCPTAANDTSCRSASGATLYANWETYTYTDADSNTVGYWDFGDSTQLPALFLAGVVQRDNDGDGVWNSQDAYPDDPTRSVKKKKSSEEGGGSELLVLMVLGLWFRSGRVAASFARV